MGWYVCQRKKKNVVKLEEEYDLYVVTGIKVLGKIVAEEER